MAWMNPKIASEVAKVLREVIEKFNFGFIENSCFINMGGHKGLLIWDYLVWNELTFVDMDTRNQQPLFSSINDTDTQAKYNEFRSLYAE